MSFSRQHLLILAVIAEGVILIAALILSELFDISLTLSTENVWQDTFIGILGAIMPIALFILSLSEKASSIPVINSLRRTVLTDIRQLFVNARLVDLFTVSLLAGVSEELLFRGVIQSSLGIITASIIFGLFHFVTRAYVIVATIMGLYIGLFYQISGSLLIPVQIHCIYDFGALVYLKYFARGNLDA
jgi:membrane protease YdiL (CAAX protease family)